MTYNKALDSYNQMNLSVEKPEKLILMLYEGALRFAHFAKNAIKEGDIEKKVHYIVKVSNIFIELINTLDYEKGGDIAYYLSGLYTHQLKLLALANAENKEEYLDDVIRVLKGLIEAWKDETGL
ncbi:flagellar export chaperone FliS [Caminibacter sp.]